VYDLSFLLSNLEQLPHSEWMFDAVQ
jgi:hypothetical protein